MSRVAEERGGSEVVHLPREHRPYEQRVDQVVRMVDAEQHRTHGRYPLRVPDLDALEEKPDPEPRDHPDDDIEGVHYFVLRLFSSFCQPHPDAEHSGACVRYDELSERHARQCPPSRNAAARRSMSCRTVSERLQRGRRYAAFCADSEQSVVSFVRRARDADDFVLGVCNFTPVPRHAYRVGVPRPGYYRADQQ